MHPGDVQTDPAHLPDDPALLQQMLRDLHAENDKMRLLIDRLTRQQFRLRSEQLPAEQLLFGFEDLEQTQAKAQAGQDAAAAMNNRNPGPQLRALPATSARCRRICPATRW